MKKILFLIALTFNGFHPTQAANLTVSAAASLTDVFTELGQQYEAIYPDTKVYFNFAGSGTLLKQIEHGAPVDVFASADLFTMAIATQAQLIVENSQKTFAHNQLVTIVQANNPRQYENLDAIISDQNIRHIAIANPNSVPAGRYAKIALDNAGLWDKIQPKQITTEHVRQILYYLAQHEIEAGIVYATDAATMPERVKIATTIALAQPPAYAVAMVKTSKAAPQAQQFIDFLFSTSAQNVLRKHQFIPNTSNE